MLLIIERVNEQKEIRTNRGLSLPERDRTLPAQHHMCNEQNESDGLVLLSRAADAAVNGGLLLGVRDLAPGLALEDVLVVTLADDSARVSGDARVAAKLAYFGSSYQLPAQSSQSVEFFCQWPVGLSLERPHEPTCLIDRCVNKKPLSILLVAQQIVLRHPNSAVVVLPLWHLRTPQRHVSAWSIPAWRNATHPYTSSTSGQQRVPLNEDARGFERRIKDD